MPEPLVPGAVPPSRPHPPYWRDSTSTLYVGDARDVLAEMADRLGRLHRHQPAVLGQARLWRGRAIRPRARPGHIRRNAAGDVRGGLARPGRRRHLLAQPR